MGDYLYQLSDKFTQFVSNLAKLSFQLKSELFIGCVSQLYTLHQVLQEILGTLSPSFNSSRDALAWFLKTPSGEHLSIWTEDAIFVLISLILKSDSCYKNNNSRDDSVSMSSSSVEIPDLMS
ncbi:uncharacterized protein LOC117178610 [Belonocnema kinseyi]|uniref:uncharacterized protein LOC117178610 n=1 Tax=Belonocnema kinseyi TaxID=2817044 RepID=UPI00143DBF1F|nr:uncharacterized protein LOC117178610 [Belonocnema kinseyi]